MAKTETVTKRKKSTAPEAEVLETDEDAFEELEDDEDETTTVEDDDLDEIDEDDEEEAPAPTKKKAKAAAKPKAEAKPKPAGSEYNSQWLAAHVTEVTGETYDARAVRMLLRKMAKDGTLERVVGETRDRYTFPEGADSEIVKAVVGLVKSGEATKIKRAGLDKVKADSDAKKAAKKAAKEAAAAAEADDEDIEDEEEVEAVVVKKSKKSKAAAAAPAKAKPSTKKRSDA